MELRHLRYFIAVAEEGSLSNAAERRLHTAQPSLSRQIRDLEIELGVKLLERRARDPAKTAPVLRSVINDYVEKVGIALKSTYEAENLSALMSLVESSRGVGLAPLYVKNMLIPSVVARPLQGESPTIDLMMGYNKSNADPLLKRFLSRADEIVEHVSQKENLPSAKKRKIGGRAFS